MKAFDIHIHLGAKIATFDVIINELNNIHISYRSGLLIEDNFIDVFTGAIKNGKIFLFCEDQRFILFDFEIKKEIKRKNKGQYGFKN